MKILQINKYSYPKGGADKYFLNVSRALKDRGHEVRLFSMTKPKKLRRSVFWSYSANQVLQNIINEFKPDVAHLHNIYHDFSPSILHVLKKNNIRSVMTLHDYKIICPNYRLYTQDKICEKCKGSKYYNCFLHKCLKDSYVLSLAGSLEAYWHQTICESYEKNINAYISPSQFLRDKFKQWGIKKNIIHLPNFVKTKQLEVEKQDYLLYFGRLEKEKGIQVLLKAMKQLPQEKLLIAGTGSYKGQDTDNVKFLGFRKNVNKLVAAAKLVIVPSLWYENNPLNILEAQALGVPVLASDIGGIPEIADNLFKAGDINDLVAKIKNYQNKPTRKPMSEDEHLDKLIKIYNEI